MPWANFHALNLRIGYEIFQRYKSYKHSDDHLTELILQTEGSWLRTVTQLELLNKIRDDLNPRLVEFFDASLFRLETKLRAARSEISILTNSDSSNLTLTHLALRLPRSRKARYSAFEDHIRRTVSELVKWQAEFDPSWLFLIRLGSSKLDPALAEKEQSAVSKSRVLADVKTIRAVLRDIEDSHDSNLSVFKDVSLLSSDRASLPDSSLEETTTSTSASPVLVDTTTYPPESDAGDVTRHVRDLARILMHAQPFTLGLLQCLGVLKLETNKKSPQQYQLIYAIPQDMNQPAVLRHLLHKASPSLDTKFFLAGAMARGVASVHAAGFVHKNIRPETILTFHENGDSNLTAFLVGFELFRSAESRTTLTGDMIWHRNLYRHPMRQGRHPEEVYQMQHDIYSLGVCLLELGLWHSFIVEADPPKTGCLLDISKDLAQNNKRQAALDIKKKFVAMATERLPSLMGQTYTKVVLSCLTCLDSNATNMFADDKDLRDEDGILVGVAFIDRVLSRLLSIQISD